MGLLTFSKFLAGIWRGMHCSAGFCPFEKGLHGRFYLAGRFWVETDQGAGHVLGEVAFDMAKDAPGPFAVVVMHGEQGQEAGIYRVEVLSQW